MISRFFNYASMHPVRTALFGVGIALATPFILPYLAHTLVAPAMSLAKIFSLTAMGTGAFYGATHAARKIGPTFNSLSANSGKVFLSGLGVGIGAPMIAPLLAGTGLAAPMLALAGIFAPAALVVGAAFMGVKLLQHGANMFKPAAPRPQYA